MRPISSLSSVELSSAPMLPPGSIVPSVNAVSSSPHPKLLLSPLKLMSSLPQSASSASAPPSSMTTLYHNATMASLPPSKSMSSLSLSASSASTHPSLMTTSFQGEVAFPSLGLSKLNNATTASLFSRYPQQQHISFQFLCQCYPPEQMFSFDCNSCSY